MPGLVGHLNALFGLTRATELPKTNVSNLPCNFEGVTWLEAPTLLRDLQPGHPMKVQVGKQWEFPVSAGPS